VDGQVLGQAGNARCLVVYGVATEGLGTLLELLIKPDRETFTEVVGFAADVALQVSEAICAVYGLLVGRLLALGDCLETTSHVLLHPGVEALV
jgi:hypothetical protein